MCFGGDAGLLKLDRVIHLHIQVKGRKGMHPEAEEKKLDNRRKMKKDRREEKGKGAKVH